MPRPPAPTATPPRSGPPVALIAAVVVIAVAIAAVTVYLVMRPDPVDTGTNQDDGAAITGAGSSPSALPDAGGLRVGEAGDDVPQVHIYEDFQCPWCGLLESVSGEAFTEAADAGDIQLTYTLMSFLDNSLDTDHSVRAANAAMCADDQGAFTDYHADVFAHQPEEEGQGWTDEQLVDLAEESGVEDIEAFTSCLEQGTHVTYVKDMQTRSYQDGVSGSPRVFIDGEELSNEDMNTLMSDPTSFPGILERVAG